MALLSSKANSLAIERMKEKDEQNRLARICTKQKLGTPIRDIGLQQKVISWIIEITDERPKGKMDYDHWLQDGTILVKVMQSVIFNSVPLEMILPIQGLNSKEERIRVLLKYLRKFGVPEDYIFNEKDLFECKNIPKVTRCIAMLGKMANVERFADLALEIPPDDAIYTGEPEDDEHF